MYAVCQHALTYYTFFGLLQGSAAPDLTDRMTKVSLRSTKAQTILTMCVNGRCCAEHVLAYLVKA